MPAAASASTEVEEVQLSPRAREIVAAARELLDEGGPEALSMRRVAARLGIRGPSLYDHIPSKAALEAALVSDAFDEWSALAEQELRGTADQLANLGRAYREYARRHPHLYQLMTARPLARSELKQGSEDRAGQSVLDAFDGDADLARAFWSFAHGMVINELNHRFPADADLDSAWARGIEAFRGEHERRS